VGDVSDARVSQTLIEFHVTLNQRLNQSVTTISSNGLSLHPRDDLASDSLSPQQLTDPERGYEEATVLRSTQPSRDDISVLSQETGKTVGVAVRGKTATILEHSLTNDRFIEL
jgi:hypothetical protein